MCRKLVVSLENVQVRERPRMNIEIDPRDYTFYDRCCRNLSPQVSKKCLLYFYRFYQRSFNLIMISYAVVKNWKLQYEEASCKSFEVSFIGSGLHKYIFFFSFIVNFDTYILIRFMMHASDGSALGKITEEDLNPIRLGVQTWDRKINVRCNVPVIIYA